MRERKKKGFFEILLLSLLVSIFVCVVSFVLWYLFHVRGRQEVLVPSESVEISAPAEVVQTTPAAIEPEEAPLPSLEEPAETPVYDAPVTIHVPEPETAVEVLEEPVEVVEETAEEVEEVRVPPAPLIMPAFVFEEELVITGSDTPVYDDDFFASFFVQGQDSLQYDDGLYYFTFSIEGDTMGTLEVLFEGEERLMNTGELRSYLSEMLTDDAYELLLGPQTGDYVPVSHFVDNGVRVDWDEIAFTVDMAFTVDIMPLRIISLASNSWSRRSYSLSGAETIQPDFFSWRTGYNLYTSLDWNLQTDRLSYSLSLSLSNYLAFGPVNLDFFYNLGLRNGEFYFNWNSYRFFYDFADSGIRLSWGNVYGFGMNPAGTSLGIQFEKSYSYGTITSPYHSHREMITITEESYVLVIRNGRVIFQRLLQTGNYRVQDFTFDSGNNEVDIMVIPSRHVTSGMDLSDNEIRQSLEPVAYHQYFDMAYDSQLLARGESLFGGSLTIGRTQLDLSERDKATGLALRVSPSYYYDYHFDDMVLSWFQDVGLTDELTMMGDYSLRLYGEEKTADISLAFRQAWLLGTSTLTTDFRLSSEDADDYPGLAPYFYTRLDHSFLVNNSFLRGLGLSLSYGNSRYNSGEGDELTLRLSFSGSLGFLRYSTSANLLVEDYDFGDIQWRFSLSTGLSPMRNMSISAGLTATRGMVSSSDRTVNISGYLTASISFSGVASASYSTNFTGSHSLSASMTAGQRDSFSANLSGFDFSDPTAHSLSGSWYHSGDLYGLSVRASAYDRYRRLNFTASLSAASFYSGGLFSLSRSTRDNFVLIRPEGSLSGGQVQVARSNQGSAQDIKTTLGTAAYSSLSSYQRNNIVVYVTPDDEFGETQTFAYELTPQVRNGYSIRISLPQEYTISGILQFDGVIQDTFSSPVYRIETAEDGTQSLVSDISLYLFADQDGRFILSSVTPGSYLFDVNYNDKWYAVRFTVEEVPGDEIRVIDFGTIDLTSSVEASSLFSTDFNGNILDQVESYLVPYDGLIDIAPARYLDSSTFWNEIFPPISEDDVGIDFFN